MQVFAVYAFLCTLPTPLAVSQNGNSPVSDASDAGADIHVQSSSGYKQKTRSICNIEVRQQLPVLLENLMYLVQCILHIADNRMRCSCGQNVSCKR